MLFFISKIIRLEHNISIDTIIPKYLEKTKYVYVNRKNNQTEKVELEKYVSLVVASEMPASFEIEALKAQAVAARTFVTSRNFIVDDSVNTQAYHNEIELKKLWGSEYENKIKKIIKATEQSKGLIMTYDSKPIKALFFSHSGGKTNNSEDYYVAKLDYLKSVDSPWDLQLVKNKNESINFNKDELADQFNLDQVDNITIIKRYDSGYVQDIMIGDKKFTGKEVREKLKLKSSNFTVSQTFNKFTFTTIGYGHGVGMSQYGAQGMALEGSDFQQILKHYYQNIKIESINNY